KVLGSGQVTHALKLTALSYSAQAKDKIEAAGGQALTV
ncbi:MAG TPA: 50S ribosomal protein L15, partial [Methanofollis liminatans]|nr:50S ribosomal protein L15 [Methanofollis liminatans]